MGAGSQNHGMIDDKLETQIAYEIAQLNKRAAYWDVRIPLTPRQLLKRDYQPSRSCRLIQAQDGWLAVNLPRADDLEMVPAWLEIPVDGDPWAAISHAAQSRPIACLLERAHMLHLAVAQVDEVRGQSQARTNIPPHMLREIAPPRSLKGLGVLDLSALWAGPLCGGLLARAGMQVTKLESPSRPDTTPTTMPILDKFLNGRKRKIKDMIDFQHIDKYIFSSNILITSARPHALARHGITPDALFSRNPHLLWIAITAYGWMGEAGWRIGFGDDCAAAGGLLKWNDGKPDFMGDALADPLTGLFAARQALTALSHGHAGLIDIALAPTSARIAHALAVC